ncbi:DEAD/DEAH box helicase [Tissierella pigra]|uniref:ATP-dependent RNA helicase CshA n=1 Tax=Tissierella pigra TaxID=2607614 RepID=A0A6N7XNA6_9FIRM|nr:DEAD/DEAH box helicase [Tissierella pigra]MBU5425216.1 DEAD/DEAH box helicase [Tissierella pigra]MSU03539.1 DEAD/DEAH box helicase [Tissierella pigra]
MEKLRFEEINLSEEIQRGIRDMGFEEMSPIQSQAIPIVLAGNDIIGQAQTGTGKTAAFGIPIIERCNPDEKHVQALVLCPTRELSIQVAEEIGKLAKYKKGISVVPIYGGQPIDRQIKALKKGANIVIGTPGRVIDHIKRKTLKVDNVNMMVLDEADEMFDMGFRDDIALVMNQLGEDRQTIFFSATMPPEIMKFAGQYQTNPEIIKVVHKELTVPKVEQAYFELKQHMKTEILSRLIDMYNPKLTIVFCNTKKKVDELIEELQSRGYFADGLHGDLKQTQRDTVMNKFRKGTIDILVATDVAARGIDVDDIDLVINYDMPQDEEYYVHRIGRTARAGREGKAFSFVSGRDIYKLRDIQRYTKTKIARKDLPTLKDIQENYTSIMLEKIKEQIDNEDLSKYEKIIETLLEEDYTSFDIAAALLKSYMANNKLDGHEELDMVDFDSKPKSKGKGSGSSSSMVRMHINIGKRKGVSPRHILSALLEVTGLPKKSVGDIDVYDKFTFIEVPSEYEDEVLDGLNGSRIKGTRVKAEIANPKRK